MMHMSWICSHIKFIQFNVFILNLFNSIMSRLRKVRHNLPCGQMTFVISVRSNVKLHERRCSLIYTNFNYRHQHVFELKTYDYDTVMCTLRMVCKRLLMFYNVIYTDDIIDSECKRKIRRNATMTSSVVSRCQSPLRHAPD